MIPFFYNKKSFFYKSCFLIFLSLITLISLFPLTTSADPFRTEDAVIAPVGNSTDSLLRSFSFDISGLRNLPEQLGEVFSQKLSDLGEDLLLVATDIANEFMKWIFGILFSVAQWLLIVTSVILNMTINLTIINFAAVVKGIPAIEEAWKTIRDLINIFLVFSLLYASIRVILQGLSSQQTTIRNIIVVAVTINFSFMVTSIAIDASNILTVQFYNVIPGIEGGQGDASSNSGWSGSAQALDNGLANTVVSLLKLSTLNTLDLFSQQATADAQASSAGGTAGIAISYYVATIMAAIVLFIVAALFIMISVILLHRFIVLLILLITSPVGFASSALPNLKLGGNWSEALASNLLFPPIFFALLWISLTVLSGLSKGIGSGANWGELLFLGQSAGSTGEFVGSALGPAIEIGLNYFVVIAMLVASVMIAKNSGFSVANSTLKTIQGGSGRIAGAILPFGAAASLNRATLGRGAQKATRSQSLINLSRQKGLRGFAGRKLLAGAEGVAGSSLDVRAAGPLKGLGLGKVQEGGVTAATKQREETYKQLGERLSAREEAKVAARERVVAKIKKDKADKEKGQKDPKKKAQEKVKEAKSEIKKERKKYEDTEKLLKEQVIKGAITQAAANTQLASAKAARDAAIRKQKVELGAGEAQLKTLKTELEAFDKRIEGAESRIKNEKAGATGGQKNYLHRIQGGFGGTPLGRDPEAAEKIRLSNYKSKTEGIGKKK